MEKKLFERNKKKNAPDFSEHLKDLSSHFMGAIARGDYQDVIKDLERGAEISQEQANPDASISHNVANNDDDKITPGALASNRYPERGYLGYTPTEGEKKKQKEIADSANNGRDQIGVLLSKVGALFVAAQDPNVTWENIKKVIESTPDLPLNARSEGETLLTLLIKNNKFDIASSLLQEYGQRVDVNLATNATDVLRFQGRSPLELACLKDITVKKVIGNTVKTVIKTSDNPPLIHELLKHGAIITSRLEGKLNKTAPTSEPLKTISDPELSNDLDYTNISSLNGLENISQAEMEKRITVPMRLRGSLAFRDALRALPEKAVFEELLTSDSRKKYGICWDQIMTKAASEGRKDLLESMFQDAKAPLYLLEPLIEYTTRLTNISSAPTAKKDKEKVEENEAKASQELTGKRKEALEYLKEYRDSLQKAPTPEKEVNTGQKDLNNNSRAQEKTSTDWQNKVGAGPVITRKPNQFLKKSERIYNLRSGGDEQGRKGSI